MQFSFTQENLEKIDRVIAKYPEKQAAIMPLLYIAQEQNGFVSIEAMREIARLLEMDETDVLGVVTFYSMYHQKQMGKYHIQVCTNVSCMLRGGYEIYDAVQKKLGLKNGEASEDHKFSLEEVECMGSCGTAPMLAVNEDFFENLSTDKALEIIDSLK
jgi:NADH-quinone oxidoreductase E subunit